MSQGVVKYSVDRLSTDSWLSFTGPTFWSQSKQTHRKPACIYLFMPRRKGTQRKVEKNPNVNQD